MATPLEAPISSTIWLFLAGLSWCDAAAAVESNSTERLACMPCSNLIDVDVPLILGLSDCHYSLVLKIAKAYFNKA